MSVKKKKLTPKFKFIILLLSAFITIAVVVGGIVIFRTYGRTLIQFSIHQNKEIIRLSSFAEPPQFAIWMENIKTHKLKTVFVTSRVSKGDWEGKANVPVALPGWFEIFRGKNSSYEVIEDEAYSAVTGATPKDDYFTAQVEVEPGSEWFVWIEMNLAGDFNDDFPEFNAETLKEDAFSCGQPALLYKAVIKAEEGRTIKPEIVSQSVWENGISSIEPVSKGITTASHVFDEIQIAVVRPKPKLIDNSIVQKYP